MPSLTNIIDKFLRRESLSAGEKNTLCDDLGAVKRSGDTITGVLSVSSPIVSTGTPTADTHVLNRKQADFRKFLHLRPMDQWNIRERTEYFVNGGTTTGTIGEWGWTSSADIAYGGSYCFATGRTAYLLTGSADNDSKAIFKGFTTSAERVAAVSCYFVTGIPASSAESAINNGAVWVGWSNVNVGAPNGCLLVGWDKDIGPNFLIRKKGDLDGTETVIDTGVAVPTGHTFWPAHFVVDIIGNEINNYYLGGGDLVRVIISGNTTSNDISVLYDGTFAASQPIYNSGLNARVQTRTNQAKSIEIIGFEVKHSSGFPTYRH